MNELAHRQRIRFDREHYGSQGAVFHLTITTDHRRRLFAEHRIAAPIFENLLSGPVAVESDLYAACLMPDHGHLLLGVKDTNIVDLVNRWKGYTTNLLHRAGIAGDIWQRSFYDHLLRAEEGLQETAEYIVCNPLRAGLVDDPSMYPYSWHRWL